MTFLFSSRQSYQGAALDVATAPAEPMSLFTAWMDEVVAAKLQEPNAMVLATVDERGYPQSRVVLLRAADAQGFLFFTNYTSAKGEALLRHPRASLLFYWEQFARQVRIEGIVRQASSEESDTYFASRPRGHQIGAWVSEQSRVITSRQWLEERVARFEREFEGKSVPRPPHWGGYRLSPERYEFWQGQDNRLHDRLLYRLVPDDVQRRLVPDDVQRRLVPDDVQRRRSDDVWIRERLSP